MDMDSVSIKSEPSDSDDSDDISMQTDNWQPSENEANTTKFVSEKYKRQSNSVYRLFMDWKDSQNDNNDDDDFLSEDMLLKYFTQLSKRYRPSSLWPTYSILRKILHQKHSVNIEKYRKLYTFLKCKSQGYVGRKGKAFTLEEIDKFINEAPDKDYLIMKVALIMGSVGGCNAHQLYTLQQEHVQDIGTGLLVSLPLRDNEKVLYKFTITGQYYEICKKYIDLRPRNCSCNEFFLLYVDGKCSKQRIGINKLGTFGKQIAMYLDLPDADMYTGHCFRKSSNNFLADSEGDVITIRMDNRWKSASVVEATNHILRIEETNKKTTQQTPKKLQDNDNSINSDNNSVKALRIVNSKNITINFYINKNDRYV